MTQTMIQTMIQTPDNFIKNWMNGINNGEIENLLLFYDKNAVLLPTFSSIVLKTPAAIRDYFERLSSREELKVSLHEKTLIVQNLNDEITLLSGIYRWEFKIDGELLNFEARFTFGLNLGQPKPIIHHHSSQIPRML
jgi:hypothetical protein